MTGGPAVEGNLLLAIASVRADSERTTGLARLLQAPCNPEYLRSLADAHGMLPLLFDALSSLPDCVQARELAQRFQTPCMEIGARNLVLAAQLLETLDILSTAGIPAAAYKGPTLAVGVYGSLARRAIGDLDIFVERQYIEQAMQLLTRPGFRHLQEPDANQVAMILRNRHHVTFVSSPNEVNHEIHWRFSPETFPVDLDTAGMMARCIEIDLFGTPVKTFAPPDLLLILCVHGANDCWHKLEQICAVARLIQQNPTWNWQSILAEADRAHARRILLLGISLAHYLLDAPVPADILGLIAADTHINGLVNFVRDRFLSGATGEPGFTQTARFHLRCRERFRDRLRHIKGVAVSPSPDDAMTASLPPALSPLYIVIRLWRLVRNYGPRRKK